MLVKSRVFRIANDQFITIIGTDNADVTFSQKVLAEIDGSSRKVYKVLGNVLFWGIIIACAVGAFR